MNQFIAACGASVLALGATAACAQAPAAAPSSAPAPAKPHHPLRNVFPSDGYAYFSGNSGSNHNLPAMYAFRGGEGARLMVIGRGYREEFPMARADAAFAAYRALLAKHKYPIGERAGAAPPK